MTDASLPEGTLTFVFTDVVGSTRLWEAHDEAMRAAMRRHDELVDSAASDAGGAVVRPRGEGDSRFLVFESAAAAVTAAAAIQRSLAEEPWNLPTPIATRIAVHTGTAELRDGDYYGSDVNRCARVRGIAHAGQVLVSDATRALLRGGLPDGFSTIDLGEHRLRDLTEPERIHQLVAPGLATDFPPLASLSAIPNNLPARISDFVGRSRELADLKELAGAHRIVTIVAPGGTGKTRLGIQVAAESADGHPDGVFLVELAPASAAEDVIPMIAGVLNVPLAGDQAVEDQLAASLRAKRMLLVLDNFEHVRAAGPQIADLLTEAPDLTALVTSRSHVGISDEMVYPLEGMNAEWAVTEAPETADGVRLFTETARRRSPDFALADADLPALRQILAKTDGSPLAILLAATWTDVLSLPEIADELARSLDFLETEMRDLPERHRSVRAVFDYSWRMLEPADRDLFARLSIFRGGFTRASASAVADASIRDLSRLARQSLITADPDRGRFSVHELLRQFGEEHLGASDTEETTAVAHHGYFSEVMDGVFSGIATGDEQEVLEVLEADIDNIRSAWRRATVRGWEIRPSYVIGLWFWHEVTGGFRPAAEMFGEAAAALEHHADPGARRIAALSRAARGWFLALLDDADGGIAEGDVAEATLREVGTTADLAFLVACRNIGLIYRGEAQRIIEACSEVAGMLRDEVSSETDRWLLLQVEAWTSHAYLVIGDVDRAATIAETSRHALERIGDNYMLIWIHEALANVARARGIPADARTHYEHVLQIAERIEHGRSIHYTLNNLGRMSDELGDPEGAIAYYRRSLKISNELGQMGDVAGNLLDIARAHVASGRPDDAASTLAALVSSDIETLQRRYEGVPLSDTAAELLAEITDRHGPMDDALHRGRRLGFQGMIGAVLDEGTP